MRVAAPARHFACLAQLPYSVNRAARAIALPALCWLGGRSLECARLRAAARCSSGDDKRTARRDAPGVHRRHVWLRLRHPRLHRPDWSRAPAPMPAVPARHAGPTCVAPASTWLLPCLVPAAPCLPRPARDPTRSPTVPPTHCPTRPILSLASPAPRRQHTAAPKPRRLGPQRWTDAADAWLANTRRWNRDCTPMPFD